MKNLRRVTSSILLLGCLIAFAGGQAVFAQGRVSIRNAGNFAGSATPDSIVAAFSDGEIVPTAEAAEFGPSLPFELAGVRVFVADQPAGIFYVSPRQVNFHIPAEVPPGYQFVQIYTPSGVTFTGEIFLAENAPALFTFANNGQGEAAAYYIPLGGFVYAIMYATGVTTRVNAAGVTTGTVNLIANGKEYPALYAGPYGFVGSQQLNIPLSLDEFPGPTPAYLRVCNQFGDCRNSNTVVIKIR